MYTVQYSNMFLAPSQVLLLGLEYANAKFDRWSAATCLMFFHQFYGSSPLDVADIWFDMVNDDGRYLGEELILKKSEKNKAGFKKYIMTHFWLWTYPKNSGVFSLASGYCERLCRGKMVWTWIKRISSLKGKKICWENVSSPEHLEILAVLVDGIDCHLRKQKHCTLPRDNKGCSHKFNKYTAKYEIAMAVHRPKCVHIAGPYKGGVHDLTIFDKSGLRQKINNMNKTIRSVRHVKLCLADRGYHSKDEEKMR